MKLKEHAVTEMAGEKQAQDPCREEKGSSAEAEVNETFEGEMDNFQTPLVRCGASAPFFFTEPTDAVTIHPPVYSAQQSRSPGAFSTLPFLKLRLTVLPA